MFALAQLLAYDRYLLPITSLLFGTQMTNSHLWSIEFISQFLQFDLDLFGPMLSDLLGIFGLLGILD